MSLRDFIHKRLYSQSHSSKLNSMVEKLKSKGFDAYLTKFGSIICKSGDRSIALRYDSDNNNWSWLLEHVDSNPKDFILVTDAVRGILDESPELGTYSQSISNFSPKSQRFGNKIWMIENLSINDGGDGIKEVDENKFYTYDAAKRVADSIKGWHLPTVKEWKDLIKASGDDYAGWALKSINGWLTSGGSPNDWNGFDALPLGKFFSNGAYENSGLFAYFWSADESSSNPRSLAWVAYLMNGEKGMYFEENVKESGFNVRLVKD